jgi:hypothetical protein
MDIIKWTIYSPVSSNQANTALSKKINSHCRIIARMKKMAKAQEIPA